MSARSPTGCGLALLLGIVAAGTAAGGEGPDAEFLEYLGSWEESDAEWIMFHAAAGRQRAAEEPAEPGADAESESTEQDDES